MSLATGIQSLYAFSFLLIPLIVLPTVTDASDTNKWVYLSMLACVTLIFWAIRTIQTKRVTIAWHPGVMTCATLTFVSILSIIIASKNPVEGLFSIISPVLFGAMTIIMLFFPSIGKDTFMTMLRRGIYGIIIIASLVSIYQVAGLGKLLFPTTPLLSDPLFSLLGTPVSTIIFFVCMLPFLVANAIYTWKKNEEIKLAIIVLSILLSITAAILTILKFSDTAALVLMPISIGFNILSSSWNTATTFLFGIGPEQFLSAYTLYRPWTINLTPLWNTIFYTNASIALHVATVFGLVGLIALIALLASFLFHAKTTGDKITAGALIIVTLFAPPSLITFICILLFFILWTGTTDIIHFDLNPFGVVIFAFIPIVFAALSLYNLGSYYRGEMLFAQSQAFRQVGNGNKTYQLLNETIKVSPSISAYHLSLAEVNISLIQSIVATAEKDKNNKPKLTDEDTKLIADLMTMGINEAKKGVKLAPNSVLAWTKLAQIYQNLIGIAKDADGWTIATYQKAISLDPTNPVLHIDLGNVFTTLKRWDEAKASFDQAIQLKSNYANIYYNISNMYKLKGDLISAKEYLMKTRDYLSTTSNEYETVTKEIDALK